MNDAKNTPKALYKQFTHLFMGILSVIGLATVFIVALFFQQTSQVQQLVDNQLTPLTLQYQQQQLLSKVKLAIDDILFAENGENFVELQQQLTKHNQRLVFLASKHDEIYHQWLVKSKANYDTALRIQSNSSRNQQLKQSSIIQLQLIAFSLDAFMVNNSQEKGQLFQPLLPIVATTLQAFEQLSVQTTLASFDQLRSNANTLFTLNAQLKNKVKADSKSVSELFEQIDALERILITEQRTLGKWQGYIRLVQSYSEFLANQQQQLLQIIKQENNRDIVTVVKNIDPLSAFLAQYNIVIEARIIAFILLFSIALLFIILGLLINKVRVRIQHSSQQCVDVVKQALQQKPIVIDALKINCAETLDIIFQVQQVNRPEHGEDDFQQQQKAYQQQSDVLATRLIELEQLSENVAQLEAELKKQAEQFLLAEKQRYDVLNSTALHLMQKFPQLMSRKTPPLNTIDWQCYFQQFNVLNRQVAQFQQVNALQAERAMLTLSDINLIAEIQASLLNDVYQQTQQKNRCKLTIEGQLSAQVKVDVCLFQSLFGALTELLFIAQFESQLSIHVNVQDVNDGQQIIHFNFEMTTQNKQAKLPPLVQQLINSDEIGAESAILVQHCYLLLTHLYGSNLCAQLSEHGYVFSFELPLAMTVNQQERTNLTQVFEPLLPTTMTVNLRDDKHYLPVPVEVLLAVESPEKHQLFQQTLQRLGLTVYFVSNIQTLERRWQTGRYLVLFTELKFSPFSDLGVDCSADLGANLSAEALPNANELIAHGVFSLHSKLNFTAPQNSNDFEHWYTGQFLTLDNTDELIELLQPWLNQIEDEVPRVIAKALVNTLLEDKLPIESKSALSTANDTLDYNADNELNDTDLIISEELLIVNDDAAVFDFNRYVKHQGTPELALYMLDDYVQSNNEQLAVILAAIKAKDITRAQQAIDVITINAKILAAEELQRYCLQWTDLLANKSQNKDFKEVKELLESTKQQIHKVASYAHSI
ncbi:MAG: hypothetical protein OCD00_13035 [Colwellia sp.]